METKLTDLFPNADMGLSNIGFLFGAGSSKEAGFPLTIELTKNVTESLSQTDLETLKTILETDGITYDFKAGVPDIETIADVIYKYKHMNPNPQTIVLEQSIKEKVVDEFKFHDEVNLENHISLFQSLKALMVNRAETIWIFTSNYDLLFEMAAMQADIPIYNGFEGVLHRYFHIDRLGLRYGYISSSRFREFKEPNIKLIKFHGSISWFKDELKIFESCDNNPQIPNEKALILPRKKKVLDSLEHPYDKLFRFTNRVIGSKCCYLVSCGYSYRDVHINEQIIIPHLREGNIRLLALFKEAPSTLDILEQFPSFNYITKDKRRINGQVTEQESDIWKFSKLVKLIKEKVGLGM
ncbi:MAG: SIR2 family protein [Candidatus Helarchaeota archaeon]